MIQYSSTFCSSNYTEKVELQLSSNVLIILNLPADIHFDEIMIIMDDRKHEVLKEILRRERNKNIVYKFPDLSDGDYYLNIYYKSLEHSGYYEPFISGACIIINRLGNLMRFCPPIIVDLNKKFLYNIKTDSSNLHKYTKPSFAIQSYDSKLIKKAKEITRFSHSDYHRLLSIHNWAARNLFYDYDLLIDDIIGKLPQIREIVLEKVFDKLSKKNNYEYITLDDIRKEFNAKCHPDVRKGIKKEKEILSEFLDLYEYHFYLLKYSNSQYDKERKIYIGDFINFYSNYSFIIENDDEFENILIGVWQL